MAELDTTRSARCSLPPGTQIPRTAWSLHVVATPCRRSLGQIFDLPTGDSHLGRGPEGAPQLLSIDDPHLSRTHLALRVAQRGDSVELADLRSRNGTALAGKAIGTSRVGHGAVIRAGETVMVLEADLGRHLDCTADCADLPGRTELARIARAELAIAATSARPVLIVGDTGTGKEHAATELHRRSQLRGPLVRVNLTAVPEGLFEAELFGHNRGAFSGALGTRLGRVREAEGGTLVLDEIGDLPLPLQAKLLRVIEEGAIRPVGSDADVPVRVRFCASTNCDLDALIRSGRFRRDLAARLSSHVVHLQPLVRRAADLLSLADLVEPLANGTLWAAALTADTVELLLLHDWPDNLRGLSRALLWLSAAYRGAPLGPEALAPEFLRPGTLPQADSQPPGDLSRRPTPSARHASEVDAAQIRPDPQQVRALLVEHGGNIEQLARAMGKHRRQVYRWLEYAGVQTADIDAIRRGS